ncbi:F-box domain-containing protein [Mycena indigotica]|uniref:F-box domain-containing protein n=1 Tax=Mycena indigotica TaxID=2126181 RepID=A0A8H6SDH4_9AGAR|nr:F-box domain-containing protein [Mycena indigotica]KAF7296745.1 F-box domain-containing protein [Mycena indigotica]
MTNSHELEATAGLSQASPPLPPIEAYTFLLDDDELEATAGLSQDSVNDAKEEHDRIPAQIEQVKVAFDQELRQAQQRANDKIAQLEKRKEELGEVIRKHQNIFSAVHKLPPSVLARIFSFSLDDYLSDTPFLGVSSDVALRNLTHVCSRWRRTAVDNAHLWTRVSLKYDYRSSKLENLLRKYPLTRLETQLHRAKQAPLDIFLDFDESHEITESTFMHWKALIGLLAPTSNRWRSMTLDSLQNKSLQNLLQPFLQPESRLEKLELLDIMGYITLENDTLVWLARGPRLRRVCLYKWNAFILPVSWHNLSELSLCSLLSDLWGILPLAANLERCRLTVVNAAPYVYPGTVPSPQPTSIAHLGNMKQFYIQSGKTVDDLLVTVSMPNLEYLVIDAPFYGVSGFLSRSKCSSLRGLRILPTADELGLVLTIARTQPLLAHLEVQITGAPRDPDCLDFIRKLKLSSPPKFDDACPRLETLLLHLRVPTKMQIAAIMRLLLNRTKTTSAEHSRTTCPLRALDIGEVGWASLSCDDRFWMQRQIKLNYVLISPEPLLADDIEKRRWSRIPELDEPYCLRVTTEVV